ncbi:hypothetical protein DASC09_031270 [Saccharomycopsis crataegensis]|uniref:Mitochondrial fission process protein 1 n=1 Tax=Saccharomycopsis crataegensis TaxID=43959 RepID=A0AAV5QLZ0_9ASCO|nr:hypothetical protein DASC09_031270 [Saccharomycopsis crataegensis]
MDSSPLKHNTPRSDDNEDDPVGSNLRYVGYGQRLKQLFTDFGKYIYSEKSHLFGAIRESDGLGKELSSISKTLKTSGENSQLMSESAPKILIEEGSILAKQAGPAGKRAISLANESSIISQAKYLGKSATTVAKQTRNTSQELQILTKQSQLPSMITSQMVKPAIGKVRMTSGRIRKAVDIQEMISGALDKTENRSDEQRFRRQKIKMKIIKVCGIMSWTYIGGDVLHETMKEYYRELGSESSTDEMNAARESNYKLVFVERTLFHSISTIAIPSVAIKYILKFSGENIFNSTTYEYLHGLASNSRLFPFLARKFGGMSDNFMKQIFYKGGPFLAVSIIFPLIPKYCDKVIETSLDNSLRKFWKKLA